MIYWVPAEISPCTAFSLVFKESNLALQDIGITFGFSFWLF
jgi:hypothetical protein